MADLLTGLGLMLVLEGSLYALFPEGMRKMMERVITVSAGQLRTAGLVVAVFGFLIVAVLRGY